LKSTWILVVFCSVLVLIACSSAEPEGDTHQGEDEGEVEDELHLEPEQLQDWGVQVGPVATTRIAAELTLPGALTLNENRTAKIGPLVPGQISEIQVDLGTRVRAGQALATMNSPEFTRAQTEFIQAFAQSELSRKDFERARLLLESRAIEEREFLRRQATYEQHLAERRAAEVVLHALGLDEARVRELERAVDLTVPPVDHAVVDPPLALRTPIGGVVIERHAVLGDHAEAGQTLFLVSDLTSLWAQLDAYEDQMAALTRNAQLAIRTSLFPERDFPGEIDYLGDQVDEQLRTVQVRAVIPNGEGLLKPNMYVQGLLRISGEEERWLVPTDAVQLLEGRHVVFVVVPAEPGEDHTVVQAREVTPGETLSVGRIIEGGLEGSETIVLQGAFNLKAELTKGAGGHAHAH
jgi:cobalt-zinc-cadmium efflux system membrane fusion protein